MLSNLSLFFFVMFMYPVLMQWLERDFLGYLKEWEDCVNARTDVPDAQKPMMLLSRETMEGLHITGNNNVYTIYGNLWFFMLAIQFI